MYRQGFRAWQIAYHQRQMGPLFLKEVCTDNEIESADAGEWIELWKRATEGKTVITDTKYEGHTLAEIIRNIPTRLLKGKVFVVRGQRVRHVDKCLDDFLEVLEAEPVAETKVESKEEVVETKEDSDSENEESEEEEVDSDEEEKKIKKKELNKLRDKIRRWNVYFKTKRKPLGNTIKDIQTLLKQMEPLKELAVQIKKFEENFRIDNETKDELESILLEYKDKKELDDLNRKFKISETDLQTAKEKIAILKKIKEFQRDFKIGDESIDELKTKLNELRRDDKERKDIISDIEEFDNEYNAGGKTIEKLKEDLEKNKLWAEIKTLVDKYFDPTNLGPLKLPKSIYRGNLKAVKELVEERGRIVEEIWKLTKTKDKQPAAEPQLNAILNNLKKEKEKEEKDEKLRQEKEEKAAEKARLQKEKVAEKARLQKEREEKAEKEKQRKAVAAEEREAKRKQKEEEQERKARKREEEAAVREAKKKKDAEEKARKAEKLRKEREEKAAEKARLKKEKAAAAAESKKEREDKKKKDAEEKEKRKEERRRKSIINQQIEAEQKRKEVEWTREKAKQKVEDDDITQPIPLGVSSSKNYTLYESKRKEYVGVQLVFEDSSQMVSVRAQGKNYSTISVERKKQDVLGKSGWKKVDKFENRRHTKTVEILDIGGVWHAQLVHEPKEIERVDIAKVEKLKPYTTPNDAQNVTLKATKDDLMIAHIPGKGKTYAAILKAEGVRNKCKDPKPRILVVAPKASIVAQWQKEVIRFGFDPRHWIFQTNAFFRKTFTTGRYVNWDMLGNSTQKMITETLWKGSRQTYEWEGIGEEATKYFNTEINATELFQDIEKYQNETTLTREGLIKKITGSKTKYVQDSVTNKFINAEFIEGNEPLNKNTMTASEYEVLKFIGSKSKDGKSRFYFFNQYQEDIFLQFFPAGTKYYGTPYDKPSYVFFTNLQYGNYLEKLKRDADNTSEKGQDDTAVMDFPDYNGESPFRRKNIRGKKQKPEGWSTTDYISDTFLKFVEKHHKIEAPNEEDCFRDFKVKQELIRSRRLRKDVKIDVLDKFVVPSHGKSVSQHRYRPESNTIFILDEAHEPEAITNNIYKVSTRLILNYCQNTVCNIMVTATPMQSEYPQRQLWTFSQLFQGKTYDELRTMYQNDERQTEIEIAKSMKGFISRSFEMQPLQKSEFLENIFFDDELATKFNDIIKMRQWGTVDKALLNYVQKFSIESRKNILKALADEIIPVAQPNPEKVTSFPTKLKMFTRFDRGRWQVEMDNVRKNICQYAKKDYEGGESVYIDYTAHVQKGVSKFEFLEQESKELCKDGVVPIVIEPSGISVDADIGIMQYLFRRAFQNENKLIVPILATKDKAKEYLGKVLLKRFTTSQKEPDRIIDRRLGKLYYYLQDNSGEGDYPQWASIENKYCPNLQSSKFIEIAKFMKEKDRAHCNGLVYHKNYEIQYGLASVMEGFGFKRIKSTELNTIDLDNVKRKILRKWEVYSTQGWTPDKEIERLKNWGALIRNASTSEKIRDMIRKLGKDLEKAWHQPKQPELIQFVKEMGRKGVQKVYRLKQPAPISTFGAYETVSDGVKYEGVVKSKGNIGGPTYKFGARWIEPATKLEYGWYLNRKLQGYNENDEMVSAPDVRTIEACIKFAIQTYDSKDEENEYLDRVKIQQKKALENLKKEMPQGSIFLKSKQNKWKDKFKEYETEKRRILYEINSDSDQSFDTKVRQLANDFFLEKAYNATQQYDFLESWDYGQTLGEQRNLKEELDNLEIPPYRSKMIEKSVGEEIKIFTNDLQFDNQEDRKRAVGKFLQQSAKSIREDKDEKIGKLNEPSTNDVLQVMQTPPDLEARTKKQRYDIGQKNIKLKPVYDRMFALDDDTFSTYAFYNGKDTPTTTRRDDVRNLFEAGILDWIIMSDAGITGVDFKSLRQSVCIMVSAGRSPGIEDQFVGRMVRENSHDLVPRLFQRVDHVTFYNTWEKESKDKTKTKLKKPRSQGVGESKSAEAFDLDELLEDMPSVTRSGRKRQESSAPVELTDEQKQLLEVMRKERDFLKLTDEEQEILDDASQAERNAVLPMLNDDVPDSDFKSDSESDGELSEEDGVEEVQEVLGAEEEKTEEKTKKKAVSGKLHTIVDSQIDNHVRISKVIQWGNRVFPTVNAYLKREPKEKVFVCHVCQYKNESNVCQNCGVGIHDRYLHMEPQEVSSADVIYPDVKKGRWALNKPDAWTREENIMWNRRDGFDSQMRRRDRLSFYLMFSTVEHLIRQQHDQVVSYTHDTGAIYTRVKIKDPYAKDNRGKQWYELIGLGGVEEEKVQEEEEYEYESEYSD